MAVLSEPIYEFLAELSAKHPARAALVKKLIDVVLKLGWEVHRAGGTYLAIDVMTKGRKVRPFHVTNAGRLSILYYMICSAMQTELGSKTHFTAVLHSAGLVGPTPYAGTQQTVHLPNSELQWNTLEAGLQQMSSWLGEGAKQPV